MTPRSAYLISTFGGLGRKVEKAPGTIGTLAAMPPGWVIGQCFDAWGLWLAALLVLVAGTAAVNRHCRETGAEDPGEVVIDEVCGIWITMACFPLNASGMIAALVLFRLFDILKPWPVCWADRSISGGFGVMADDVLAGIYPWALLSGIALLTPGGWDWYGTLAQLP